MLVNQFPVFGEYDVVVAGGGVAGFAAGVSAARNGAKTLIVEQNGFLGGTATAGMVGQMIGFTEGQMGIARALVERLVLLNATDGYVEVPLAGSDIYVKKVNYDPEVMKMAMDAMSLESGAEILFHGKVIDVSSEDNSISGIVVHTCAGYQLIKGKVFIDATFHGDLAAWSGCKWEIGRPEDGKAQPATLLFRLANVDLEKFRSLPEEEKDRIIEQGLEWGKLFTRFVIASSLSKKDEAIFNMSRVLDIDPLDARSLTKAEIEGRKQVQKILDYMKKNAPGFEEAVLVGTGTSIGLRDSRRIIGKYVLSKEDIMSGLRFADAVAICSYPMDEHDPSGAGIKYLLPQEGKYYIPFRCLVTDQVKNLILAGRCISATYDAHASLRVMPICLALGQAAGLGAVLSLHREENVNQLDGSLVSSMLFE